jgi:hypothetical protein
VDAVHALKYKGKYLATTSTLAHDRTHQNKENVPPVPPAAPSTIHVIAPALQPNPLALNEHQRDLVVEQENAVAFLLQLAVCERLVCPPKKNVLFTRPIAPLNRQC